MSGGGPGEMSEDLKEIYLQPDCCAGGEGREWADSDVWECEEGVAATRYVRVDLDCHTLHPASEWTEADGEVLWWARQRDGGWSFMESGKGNVYAAAHWSRIPAVELKEGK